MLESTFSSCAEGRLGVVTTEGKFSFDVVLATPASPRHNLPEILMTKPPRETRKDGAPIFGYTYQTMDFIGVEKEVGDSSKSIFKGIMTKLINKSEDTKNASPVCIYGLDDTALPAEWQLDVEAQKLETFLSKHMENERCYYCGYVMSVCDDSSRYPWSEDKQNNLIFPEYADSANPTYDDNTTFCQEAFSCPYCGWWKMPVKHTSYQYVNNSERQEIRWGRKIGKYGLQENISLEILAFGIMKEFEISGSDAPLLELRKWLARHPEHITNVDPIKFEELIYQCFRDQKGENEVIRVGGRKDKGIDLILVNCSDDRILVQIKRREDNNRLEGVDVVRQLNGVLLREGIPTGMVVTTARGFTRDAIAEATFKSYGRFSRHRVDLLSFEHVKELIVSTCGNDYSPWLREDDYLVERYHWLNRIRSKHRKTQGVTK